MTQPKGFLWFCLIMLLVGLALLLGGWDAAGALAILATFALSLGSALSSGRYAWLWTSGQVRRDSRPTLFWTLAAINTALMLLSLWHFVQVLQAGRG